MIGLYLGDQLSPKTSYQKNFHLKQWSSKPPIWRWKGINKWPYLMVGLYLGDQNANVLFTVFKVK